jgi:hypothetical protein
MGGRAAHFGDQTRNAHFGKNGFFQKIFCAFFNGKSQIAKIFLSCAARLRDQTRNTGG